MMDNARQAMIRQIRLIRERARRESEASLSGFVRNAWHVVEPGRPYEHGWHIDAVSEHLQAVTLRQIRNLVINLPPRHTKSLCTNVFWPAWVWGPAQRPQEDWIFAAYSPKLSSRDSAKCRQLLEAPWYLANWSKVFTTNDGDRRDKYIHTGSILRDDQNEKMNYRNIVSGSRISTSIGGVGTGIGADILVVDDPHKVKGAESDTIRQSAIDWFVNEMSTRGNDPATFCKVVVMQRVHMSDLTGVLMDQFRDQYEFLILPFEHDPQIFVDLGVKDTTSIGFKDPRTEVDQRLWSRFDGKPGDDLKASMKPDQRSGQLGQRPTAKQGEIFKAEWFVNRWREVPKRFQFLISCWDLTFGTGDKDEKGEKARGAFDVGYILGWVDGKYYVMDEVRRRLEPHEQEAETKALRDRWAPMCRTILIEDAANGRATAKKIEREVSGVILVRPQGSKEDRAMACTSPFQAGCVLFPADDIKPWAADAVAEIVSFGAKAKFKDRVDALVHGVEHIESKVAEWRSIAVMPTSMSRESFLSQV